MTANLRASNALPAAENGRTIQPADDVSLLAVLNVLLRYRRLIFVLPVLFATAAIAISLLKQRTYTASAAFIPQTSDAFRASPIAGMAAQFGVSLGSSQPSESPAFYSELMGTRSVLSAVANREYTIGRKGAEAHGTLAQLLKITGTEPDREERTVRYLKRAIKVSTSRETNIVGVSATTNDPALSRDLVVQMLGMVNRFNVERRQSQAKAERVFVEARMQDVKRDLHAAEDRLQLFLQRNRAFRNSPELTFENERLQRDVDMQQQVYTSFAETYERARIEEVRNIPVITILQDPTAPFRPNPRGTTVRVLTGLSLGLLLALIAAFTLEYFRRSRGSADEDVAVFDTLRRQAVDDVRRLFLRAPRGRAVPATVRTDFTSLPSDER